MGNSITVRGLEKQYSGFSLRDVNSACRRAPSWASLGKTRGQNHHHQAILGLVHADAGEITMLKPARRAQKPCRERPWGVVMEGLLFQHLHHGRWRA